MRLEFRPGAASPALFGALLLAALGLAPLGCGSDGRVKLYPASGRVTVGDEPAAGVKVRFFNAAKPDDLNAPLPFATTDEAGNYRLGTYEEGDGAPAGRYLVVIVWPIGPPGPGVPADRLGNAFTDLAKTPYRAEVPEGGGTLESFKIDPALVNKPSARPSSASDPSNPAGPGGA